MSEHVQKYHILIERITLHNYVIEAGSMELAALSALADHKSVFTQDAINRVVRCQWLAEDQEQPYSVPKPLDVT